jgi:hypothetical protein
MKILIKILFIITIGLGFSAPVEAIEIAGVDIHGFASQGFVQTINQDSFIAKDSGKGSFDFNEFGINFSKQINPDLHMGLQFFAQDRGNYGKDKITLDWAFGDYRLDDWLGFRAGKIKNPIGLYNETRDADTLRTFVLLPQGIYADAQRDNAIALNGAGIYGSMPVGIVGTLDYQVQVGVLPMETDGGSAQQMKYKINSTGNGTATVTDAGSSTTVLHNLEWRLPIDGLKLAATGIHTSINFEVNDAVSIGTVSLTSPPAPAGAKAVMFAPRSTTINNRDLHKYLFSTEYTWRDLVVAGEYMMQDFDATSVATVYSSNPAKVTSKIVPTKRDSWYVSATYRINDYFELGSYYNEYYGNRDNRDSNYQKDTAVTLRIDPLKNLVLKLEGHYLKGTDLLLTPFNTDDWYIFATKVTYSF